MIAASQGLTLVKAVDKTQAHYGDALTYTLTAGATGNTAQTGATVTDLVPVGTTFVSATCASPCAASYDALTKTVMWAIGGMSPGDSVALTFGVTIDTPAAAANGALPSRVIDNFGTIGSDQVPALDSNVVRTVVVAVLGVKLVKPPVLPRVVPPAPVLPKTGVPAAPAAALALLLIVVGSGLVVAASKSANPRQLVLRRPPPT
ncbi:MAG: hypothetical protein ABR520_05945 [Mycobacteriales bacterium]